MSMIKYVIVISLLTVLINVAHTPSIAQTANEKRNSPNMRSLAATALASLVVVFAKDKDGKVISQGSGFFVKRTRPPKTVDLDSVEASLLGASDKEVEAIKNRSVWIVTNLHVLKWAEQIEVKEVVSGKVYPVSEAVGVDLNNDLCFLKLKDYRAGRPLEVADSDKVSVGDSVLVAGNPKGLEGTISRGIVSALRKADNLIQIDAPVSPGSSGGPVLNEQGRVIGVVVGLVLGGQNLNFVIPSNLISRTNLSKNLPIKLVGARAVTSRERDKLSGPVKRAQVLQYELKGSDKAAVSDPPLTQTDTEYGLKGAALGQALFWKGSLRYRKRFEYGTVGCVVRTSTTDQFERITIEETTEDECLSRGLWTKMFSDELTVEPEPGVTLTLKFDRFGNEVERVQTEKGRINKTTSTYDERGLLIQQRQTYEKDYFELRTFTYKFDRIGNWIEQVESTQYSFAPEITSKTKITLRRIEYFEN